MDILLPVGEREGVKRAKMIQEKVTGFKGSPIPAFTSLKIHEFLGLLPPSWLSWMTSMAVFPVTVTDFPGPTAPPRLLGKKVVDVHFMLGQIPGGEGETSKYSRIIKTSLSLRYLQNLCSVPQVSVGNGS